MNDDSLGKLREQMEIALNSSSFRIIKEQLLNSPSFHVTREHQEQILSSPSFRVMEEHRRQILNSPAFKEVKLHQEQMLHHPAAREAMHQQAILKENFPFSYLPMLEIQQILRDTVLLFGTKAIQVPSFEKLPEETKKIIQSESIIAEEKRDIVKCKPKKKARHRLLAKARKESLRAKVADWITIISGLIWLYAYVSDPDFKQEIFDKAELLVIYVEYLQEILQTMN